MVCSLFQKEYFSVTFPSTIKEALFILLSKSILYSWAFRVEKTESTKTKQQVVIFNNFIRQHLYILKIRLKQRFVLHADKKLFLKPETSVI